MALTQRGFLSYGGNRAPKPPFELNRGNPLYDSSLKLALAPFRGLGFENLVPGGVGFASTNFTTNTIGVYGRKYEKSADVDFVTLSSTISISNGFTISIVYDDILTETFTIGAYHDVPFEVHLLGRAGTESLAVFDTASRDFSPTVWPTVFPAWVTVTYDGTTVRCYVDGIEAGTVAASLSEPIEVILGDNGNARAWSPCLKYEIWGRPLSPAEVWFHHGLPTRWDLYWQPSNKLYSFPVATGPFISDYRFRQRFFG